MWSTRGTSEALAAESCASTTGGSNEETHTATAIMLACFHEDCMLSLYPKAGENLRSTCRFSECINLLPAGLNRPRGLAIAYRPFQHRHVWRHPSAHCHRARTEAARAYAGNGA